MPPRVGVLDEDGGLLAGGCASCRVPSLLRHWLGQGPRGGSVVLEATAGRGKRSDGVPVSSPFPAWPHAALAEGPGGLGSTSASARLDGAHQHVVHNHRRRRHERGAPRVEERRLLHRAVATRGRYDLRLPHLTHAGDSLARPARTRRPLSLVGLSLLLSPPLTVTLTTTFQSIPHLLMSSSLGRHPLRNPLRIPRKPL